MANKRNAPVVTHVEILALALRSIDAEIGDWQQKSSGNTEIYLAATEQTRAKRDAIAYIYRLETGVDY